MSVMKPILTFSWAWTAQVARAMARETADSAMVFFISRSERVSEWKVGGGASFPERALRVGLGGEDLVARQLGVHLEVVPGLLGVGRRLDLDQVHVVHHAAVRADRALGVEV